MNYVNTFCILNYNNLLFFLSLWFCILYFCPFSFNKNTRKNVHRVWCTSHTCVETLAVHYKFITSSTIKWPLWIWSNIQIKMLLKDMALGNIWKFACVRTCCTIPTVRLSTKKSESNEVVISIVGVANKLWEKCFQQNNITNLFLKLKKKGFFFRTYSQYNVSNVCFGRRTYLHFSRSHSPLHTKKQY